MKTIRVKTSKRFECIDITEEIQEFVSEQSKDNGAVLVYVPHASAAVIINENADPDIQTDFLEALEKNFPSGIWRHDKLDGNAAAHIKSSILGPSELIPFENKKLLLGTWQACMLVELDGPRERKVLLSVV
ncbi:YjbQ family protein [Candidatus Pacearchaeota archaeon]|nr:MAG: YjbQ family protein [Candidatus Pacearchaeota archaeon]